jgi:hypothetical protein
LLASFAAMMWLGVGSQIAKSRGLSHNQMKTLSTDSCPLINSTVSAAISKGLLQSGYPYFFLLRCLIAGFLKFDFIVKRNEADSVILLWRISYLWYTMIGMLIVLIFGTIISFLCGPQNPLTLDPKLVYRFSDCFRSNKVIHSLSLFLRRLTANTNKTRELFPFPEG